MSWSGFGSDRIGFRKKRGVEIHPHRLEEEPEIVIDEAVADEQRRPAFEAIKERLRHRMKRRLVAHAQDELDVILVRHHRRLRLIDIAVELANEWVRGRRIVRRIFGRIFGRRTVNAKLRLLANRAQALLEELVEVCRHHQRKIQRRQAADGGRRDLADVNSSLIRFINVPPPPRLRSAQRVS